MSGGDATGILGWGIRRYAWLLVLFMVAGGVLAPWLLNRAPARYDAQAQVGAASPVKFNNLDPLPILGESVFTNGAVAATIRKSVNPPMPNTVSVIPQRVELITSQDNVVFVVVGHAATPRAAARYANLAATAFTAALNKYSRAVGSFAVQKVATPPAAPTPRLGGGLATAVGVLVGLVAGAGVVVLLLAVRRPVLSPASAVDATGAEVFGRLVLDRFGKGVRGLPHLVRTLREHRAEALLLVGPRQIRPERRMLAAGLTEIRGPGGPLIVDQPGPAQIVAQPDSSLVLLVVPEGIAHASLRRQAELYLDGRNGGVLLVRGRSRHWLHRRPQDHVAERPRPSGSPAAGVSGHGPAGITARD